MRGKKQEEQLSEDELSDDFSDEDDAREKDEDEDSDDDSVFSRAEKLFKFAEKHVTGERGTITRTLNLIENGANTAKKGMNMVNRLKSIYNTFNGVAKPQSHSLESANSSQPQNSEEESDNRKQYREHSDDKGGFSNLLSAVSGVFGNSNQDPNSSSSFADKVQSGMHIFKTLSDLF